MTANLAFNLRRGRLLPERQMVKGYSKQKKKQKKQRMLGNSSLTPVAHLMTYSETGTPRLNERRREAPACARNLTAYLHILKPSCNIAPPSSAVVCFPLAPIFCLIVIHVQSVCLANLLVFTPSPPSCVCLRVTEFILCYLLYYLHCRLILTSLRFSSR